jgi:RING finger/CHY zinc finger protein 1
MNPANGDDDIITAATSSKSSSTATNGHASSSSLSASELQQRMSADEQAPSYQSDDIMGCKHYQRGCKYKAECCGRWFVCRLCHDADQSHPVDRYATKFMYCMHCRTVQPWANACGNPSCGAVLGAYACSVCKFHDSTPDKDIYHCGKCGMCRVGKGLEVDFFHCDRCGVCMSVEMRDHVCIEHNLDSSCPICAEHLHTSVKSVVFMNCGHAIHRACLVSYQRTNFVCPTCSRSLFEDMSPFWEHFAQVIASQAMPPEFEHTKVSLLCNDCSARSRQPFHFVGHKCAHCGGYNTRVLKHHRLPKYDSQGALVANDEEEEDVDHDDEKENEDEEDEDEDENDEDEDEEK